MCYDLKVLIRETFHMMSSHGQSLVFDYDVNMVLPQIMPSLRKHNLGFHSVTSDLYRLTDSLQEPYDTHFDAWMVFYYGH